MDKGFKGLIKPKDTPADVIEVIQTPPSFCIESDQMSGIKDFELGKEYTVKARMTRREEQENGEMHCSFEVVSVDGKSLNAKEDVQKDENSEENTDE
jgi:hypothetical protein